MKNATTWPRAPHASVSTRVKPAGSLVLRKFATSFARSSPASKWVIPFCTGRPALATCARWKGRKTMRPRKRRAAVLTLTMRVVSAQVVRARLRVLIARDAGALDPTLSSTLLERRPSEGKAATRVVAEQAAMAISAGGS
eukprot:TRINITY_DN11234_c0_g1_i1.p2 TRINITY_DN11234_c0_g1~~TRINITY_DN11234_c0_g1_i1.p2  ORF type:complete len:140 (-),score=5.60 TRINITY_DN11234_c0_g1_i1:81-500(-)